MGKVKFVEVEADVEQTLEEWLSMIKEFIKLYGKDSIMYTDAGYNNVALKIIVKKA